MDTLLRLWPILRLTIVGFLIGYLIGSAWELYLSHNKPLLLAVLGSAIGFFCLPLQRWLVGGGRQLNLESVDVKVPFLGTMKVSLSDAHRMVGWKLFIELSTRVATQPLVEGEGRLREALDSLYSLFQLTRSELKNMSPSPLPVTKGSYTVESYAVRMLNDGLRPMLRRWHPRLLNWEKQNLAESEWPLAKLCREDLEKTRQIVLAYTWGLAEMLKVADLENLLPPRPQGQKPELTSLEILRSQDSGSEAMVSAAQRAAGWQILVELSSRIATQALGPHSGLLSEALCSHKVLFDFIRNELKQIPPPPVTLAAKQTGQESVEFIAMKILNQRLRPFLAKWNPQLVNWEKANSAKAEVEWPDNENCRHELESLRKEILVEAKKLSDLIGVRCL